MNLCDHPTRVLFLPAVILPIMIVSFRDRMGIITLNRRTLANLLIIATLVFGLTFASATQATAQSNLPIVSCAAAGIQGKITYLASSGKQSGISLTDANGTTTNCLVNFKSANAFNLAWSPDGANLGAIVHEANGAGQAQQYLYTISANGQNIRQIAPAEAFVWSPTSQQVAFAAATDIWVASLTGGAARNLTNNQKGSFSPTWSPDGKYIAYSRPDGIHVVDAATGANDLNLTNSPQLDMDSHPTWSPNGQMIAYSSRRNNLDQVIVVNLITRTSTVVSDGVTHNNTPVWSPTGDVLAFLSAPSRVKSGDTRIMLVGVNGENRHRLTNSTLIEASVSFSRNGQQLVYAATVGLGQSKIFVSDLNGNTRKLINTAGNEASPSWQP